MNKAHGFVTSVGNSSGVSRGFFGISAKGFNAKLGTPDEPLKLIGDSFRQRIMVIFEGEDDELEIVAIFVEPPEEIVDEIGKMGDSISMNRLRQMNPKYIRPE